MNNHTEKKALDIIKQIETLSQEANSLLENITIEDINNHETLGDNLAKMEKLVNEMRDRQKRIQDAE